VTQHKHVSNVTANTIDEEIRKLIDDNYARAESILKDNMDKLHAMADGLIKYETIDEKQIDDIMNGRTPRPPEGWDESGTPPPVQSDVGDSDVEKPIGGPASQH
ncbi:MAG: ATP-dependent metalloprotease, partial [Gammaproteobacteria bacterium]|nr:ATP-dependent metalloprotease [Gammaproteobacteria bacterium]